MSTYVNKRAVLGGGTRRAGTTKVVKATLIKPRSVSSRPGTSRIGTPAKLPAWREHPQAAGSPPFHSLVHGSLVVAALASACTLRLFPLS
jgi:hypothetical protein